MLFLETICLENCFPNFYSEVVSVLSLWCVSCMQKNAGSCLHVQSVSLCLWGGELLLGSVGVFHLLSLVELDL